MAKKFIDAEKFKNAIKENKLMAREAATKRILEMLEKQPHADVQEVKHAEWKINCDGYYPYCSNCKQEPPRREMSQYCPHCGCRMDGDENAKTNLRKP